MRNQRARPVPTFQGNDRLKFTEAEQHAIRVAERALGHRSQPRTVAGPPVPPRHSLGRAIGWAIFLLLLAELLVLVF
jgi:hypothetical protein